VCRSRHRDIGAGNQCSFQWAEVGAVVWGAGQIPRREIRLPFQSHLKAKKSVSAAILLQPEFRYGFGHWHSIKFKHTFGDN
jgi:hypothetical protein